MKLDFYLERRLQNLKSWKFKEISIRELVEHSKDACNVFRTKYIRLKNRYDAIFKMCVRYKLDSKLEKPDCKIMMNMT